MKNKTEIILEIKVIYSNPDNRGIESGCCVYLAVDGKMCALGRCLINPGKMPNDSLRQSPVDSKWYIDYLKWSDNYLKEEYRGHEPEFWKSLQDWHDAECNFNRSEQRISEDGEKEIKRLLKIWVSNEL